ncbi:class I SAM-dependent methyltransferase [Nonomuraea longispora]|uniref:Class I SAM-dependent methyltransferase n=1 Tax=Nonomuraea longispora TaxID=1848320 RepID=A0A4R4NFZ6_9ACTN|nr:class I SAM-dependent methyltransferase [Nonomuraea longispora]TDC08158.1 class I SAM-dependent methyltransferase [Nonomuraea longispora]
MPKSWSYSFQYKTGMARWAGRLGLELRDLVTSGRISPETHPRVVDLGCGRGEAAIFLAKHGFRVVGVDFSSMALNEARAAAAKEGVADRCRFVEGDLTAAHIPGVEGAFDLVLDLGTLDDLQGRAREAMAATVKRLSGPGSLYFLWCVHHDGDLPFTLKGILLRLNPKLVPGEEDDLFGDVFKIERLPSPPPSSYFAGFLMTRQ